MEVVKLVCLTSQFTALGSLASRANLGSSRARGRYGKQRSPLKLGELQQALGVVSGQL